MIKSAKSLKEQYECELHNLSFGEADINFVLSLITEFENAPCNDVFQKIKERLSKLEKALNEINDKISLAHDKITSAKSLKELYERELRSRSLDEGDINFVLGLITEMDIDPCLNMMDNDAFQKIKERGPELEKAFNEINEKYKISWTHNNEPEK